MAEPDVSSSPPCPMCTSSDPAVTRLMGSVILWFKCFRCGHIWCVPPAKLEPSSQLRNPDGIRGGSAVLQCGHPERLECVGRASKRVRSPDRTTSERRPATIAPKLELVRVDRSCPLLTPWHVPSATPLTFRWRDLQAAPTGTFCADMQDGRLPTGVNGWTNILS
jgi:hypothetical protein